MTLCSMALGLYWRQWQTSSVRAVRRHNVDKKQVSRNIPTGDECKIKFNDRETFGKKIRAQRKKTRKTLQWNLSEDTWKKLAGRYRHAEELESSYDILRNAGMFALQRDARLYYILAFLFSAPASNCSSLSHRPAGVAGGCKEMQLHRAPRGDGKHCSVSAGHCYDARMHLYDACCIDTINALHNSLLYNFSYS